LGEVWSGDGRWAERKRRGGEGREKARYRPGSAQGRTAQGPLG
jgi:hypothetical protein